MKSQVVIVNIFVTFRINISVCVCMCVLLKDIAAVHPSHSLSEAMHCGAFIQTPFGV